VEDTDLQGLTKTGEEQTELLFLPGEGDIDSIGVRVSPVGAQKYRLAEIAMSVATGQL
jgi:hypothetical protein